MKINIVEQEVRDPEILVIDDQPDFAQSAADLIQAKYGFACSPLCRKEDVIECIKHNIIKVAVIDQGMPDITGTELFREIKKISPNTKAIMLTGQTSFDSLGEAVNLDFSSYLHKRDITKLPDEVFKLYVEYEKDLSHNLKKNVRKAFYKEKKLLVFPQVSYSIVSIDKIDSDYVFKESWMPMITINAGQELEHEETIEFEDKIIITEEFEKKIKEELELSGKISMATFKNTINAELNKKYSTQHTKSQKENVKNKEKWLLPKEPEDPSKPHIVKRIIEKAPVHIEYKIIIEKECTLCNSTIVFPIIIYKQTNKIKTKQIDYYNNGTYQEIYTGTEKLRLK